jgi:hypothetical protein
MFIQNNVQAGGVVMIFDLLLELMDGLESVSPL